MTYTVSSGMLNPTHSFIHVCYQLPDVGAELTGGCSGLSTKYLHWEEALIVGGAYHGKTGQLRR